jgi:hypothetical protein
VEPNEERMVIDGEFQKEVIMLQLEKLKRLIDDEEDIMQMMEDKPFVCGNQTMLDYPRSLRIQIKISYHDFED